MRGKAKPKSKMLALAIRTGQGVRLQADIVATSSETQAMAPNSHGRDHLPGIDALRSSLSPNPNPNRNTNTSGAGVANDAA